MKNYLSKNERDNWLLAMTTTMYLENIIDIWGKNITAEEKIRFANPYSVFSYAGDGSKTKTFQLDDSYSFAIVFQKFCPSVEIDGNSDTVVHFAVAGRVFGSSTGVTLTGNSLIVTQDEQATEGVKNNFNEAQGQYVALLFN